MVGIDLRLLYENHGPRKAPHSLKSRLENVNPTAQGKEKESLLVWSGFSVGKKLFMGLCLPSFRDQI